MSKKLPFTQASIARLIKGVEATGRFVVGVKPDGTLIVSDNPIDVTSLFGLTPKDDPLSKWEDGPQALTMGDYFRGNQTPTRRFGEKINGGQPASVWEDKRPDEPNPLAAALDRYRRGEITFDQLPPGRYPSMRIYADGEWEAIVRSRPLGKREVAALKAYAEADGLPNFRDSGPDTNERLEIRGLIEKSDVPRDGKVPHYRITEAGKVEWLRLTNQTPADQQP